MATARKKKASKKTSKRKTSKRKTSRKRRTPAQIAATKRLVAANKARAGKKAGRKRVAKRGGVRRRSRKYWSKWSAAQPERRDVGGRLMFQGPMTPAQDRAMRSAMRGMGMAYDEPTAETYLSSTGQTLLQSEKVRRRRKAAKKPAKKRSTSRRSVSAEAIIKASQKSAKLSKIGKLLASKRMPPKRSAVWMCGNPKGKRTGCGGGKKRLSGSRVIGIFQ